MFTYFQVVFIGFLFACLHCLLLLKQMTSSLITLEDVQSAIDDQSQSDQVTEHSNHLFDSTNQSQLHQIQINLQDIIKHDILTVQISGVEVKVSLQSEICGDDQENVQLAKGRVRELLCDVTKAVVLEENDDRGLSGFNKILPLLMTFSPSTWEELKVDMCLDLCDQLTCKKIWHEIQQLAGHPLSMSALQRQNLSFKLLSTVVSFSLESTFDADEVNSAISMLNGAYDDDDVTVNFSSILRDKLSKLIDIRPQESIQTKVQHLITFCSLRILAKKDEAITSTTNPKYFQKWFPVVCKELLEHLFPLVQQIMDQDVTLEMADDVFTLFCKMREVCSHCIDVEILHLKLYDSFDRALNLWLMAAVTKAKKQTCVILCQEKTKLSNIRPSMVTNKDGACNLNGVLLSCKTFSENLNWPGAKGSKFKLQLSLGLNKIFKHYLEGLRCMMNTTDFKQFSHHQLTYLLNTIDWSMRFLKSLTEAKCTNHNDPEVYSLLKELELDEAPVWVKSCTESLMNRFSSCQFELIERLLQGQLYLKLSESLEDLCRTFSGYNCPETLENPLMLSSFLANELIEGVQ